MDCIIVKLQGSYLATKDSSWQSLQLLDWAQEWFVGGGGVGRRNTYSECRDSEGLISYEKKV